MAQDELSDGTNPEPHQLAQHIIDAHKRQITEMQTLLGGPGFCQPLTDFEPGTN